MVTVKTVNLETVATVIVFTSRFRVDYITTQLLFKGLSQAMAYQLYK